MSMTRHSEVSIHLPPGVDLGDRLERLNTGWIETEPEYRRMITRNDPLLFMLVYLEHHLVSEDTGGRLSFSDFHLAFLASARRWRDRRLGPMAIRDGWVAPRGAAKSTLGFLGAPLWALAHDHRRFAAMFSDTGPQAGQHLSTLKRELDTNARLRRDYPMLCRPAIRPRGQTVSDTQINYLSAGGHAIMAKGIEAATLGAKSGNERPDLLLFDDVEPAGRRYSPDGKTKRLATIIDAVLAMNDRAVVQFLGTTTMYGSIMHDLVLAALGAGTEDWITEQRIRPHYFPAIVTEPDGSERSLWPQRWTLEYLRSIQATRYYLLNLANTPPSADAGYWSPEDIRVVRGVELDALDITERVLTVDPAVTSNQRSDLTGISVVGSDSRRMGAVVEYARGFRFTPDQTREHVHGQLARNRKIRKVRVENIQGGEYITRVLGDLPFGVECEPYRPPYGKPPRFAECLDWYQRGWAVHAGDFPALVAQMLAYPHVRNDDVIDSVDAGLRYFLHDRLEREPR